MSKETKDSVIEIHTTFNGLNHLRAFAIVYVFLFHYFILSNGQPGWLPGAAKFGWTGVDLFFVLSGFLISSQLFLQIRLNQAVSFRLFFLKRFFRIIPVFLVTVGLYFLFPFFREKEKLPPIWKFLSFTQNFDLNLKDFGTFSHAWSLCVEEHFYLFLPLILITFQLSKYLNKAVYLIPMFFFLGLVARIYSFNELYLSHITDVNSWMYWYKYIYYPTYNRLDGLLAGVLIAAIYRFRPNLWYTISKHGNLLLLLSLFVLTGAYFLCEDQQGFTASVFGYPLIALGYGIMVAGAISPSTFFYKWNSAVTAFIATLSYGVYLSHKGVIHITHKILEEYNLNSNLLLGICIVNCLLMAYVLHKIVEKPFLKLRDKVLKS